MSWSDSVFVATILAAVFFLRWRASCASTATTCSSTPAKPLPPHSPAHVVKLPGVPDMLTMGLASAVDRTPLNISFEHPSTPPIDLLELHRLAKYALALVNGREPALETTLIALDSYSVEENENKDRRYSIVFVAYERVTNTTVKLSASIVTLGRNKEIIMLRDLRPWSRQTPSLPGYAGDLGHSEFTPPV